MNKEYLNFLYDIILKNIGKQQKRSIYPTLIFDDKISKGKRLNGKNSFASGLQGKASSLDMYKYIKHLFLGVWGVPGKRNILN